MNNLVGSWRDGAKTVNPEVETSVVYISDMGDVAKAQGGGTVFAGSRL